LNAIPSNFVVLSSDLLFANPIPASYLKPPPDDEYQQQYNHARLSYIEEDGFHKTQKCISITSDFVVFHSEFLITISGGGNLR
jgi:hypothetical protein